MGQGIGRKKQIAFPNHGKLSVTVNCFIKTKNIHKVLITGDLNI